MAINNPIPLVERSVSDSMDTPTAPRRRSFPRQLECEDGMMLGIGLIAGSANTIMQMSYPGVGYGVIESRVDSGRADLHPLKRARTTLSYLAVAIQGTDSEKAAFRQAVNGSHRQVRSTADSPVKYNAFDRDLQLWVGACLYKGNVDIHRLFLGEMDDEHADRHYYTDGKALATTLQVPEDMWPADRAAFDRYWQKQLDKIHIDPPVHQYLMDVAMNRHTIGRALPKPLRRANDRFNLLMTTGMLPHHFRDAMQLPWDADKQRQFDRVIRILRTTNNVLPGFLRSFPFNFLMRDVRRRIRSGRPLV